MGLRVAAAVKASLLWADLLVAQSYQFDHPDWTFALDADPAAAAAARIKMLDMVAADGMMVAGAHLDFPGFGYVDRAREGYRLSLPLGIIGSDDASAPVRIRNPLRTQTHTKCQK
jgi:hypothetical protein